MHNNCICNEYRSLVERHLAAVSPRPDTHYWNTITNLTQKFYIYKLERLRFTDIINRYSGEKRKRYYNAALYIKEFGLRRRHCKVKMFIKNDRSPVDKLISKAPRAIQFRAPEINLMMMQYVKPFEDCYYRELKYGVVSDSRVIAKGLNWRERAQLLVDKASFFRHPRFVMLDHSSFDNSITMQMIKTTHRKYRLVFGKQINSCFRHQIRNKGRTRMGIRYVVPGTRMSGDADTALGNTLINLDAIWGALWSSNIEKYDMLVDGDDAIVIIEDGANIDYEQFARMGLRTKVSETLNIHHAEFCQSRIVLTPEPVFVRNPYKVISHAPYARRSYQGRYDDWLSAVGMCERACNAGVPVLQVFADQLAQLGTGKPIFDRDLRRRMEGMVVNSRPVVDIARLTFYEAWNISPPMQLLLEDLLTSQGICDRRNKQTYFRFSYDRKDDESLQRQRTWYESSVECSSGSWWCGRTGGYRSIY
uniref:RNA-directed RNA polymerase n=1 Tax=Hymenopteran tombus-related virus TaxID=2822555 RepID=A0A8A6RHW2_9TOMB|nr:RNA-dependent RNA polymerase [Hymenopteran tombus-related virus]